MRIGEVEQTTMGQYIIKPRTVDFPYYIQDEGKIQQWTKPHQLQKVEGTWYKNGKRVVTGGLTIKRQLIRNHHDLSVYGHPGIRRTTELIERSYWWPRMKMDILMYVKGCAECQRMKINTRPTKAPLQPLYPKQGALPFEVVTMDLITKLPISQGCDSILTVTDHDCTKAVVLIPCKEMATAEDIAALYVRHMFV